MFPLLNRSWKLLLIPLFALVFVLSANLFYYRGSYTAPPANKPALEQLTVEYAPVRSFAEVLPSREGTLVVDMAHFNRFDEDEINVLLSRVADIGYRIEVAEDSFGLQFLLEGADSFLVILPQFAYRPTEVAMVEGFVENGGKLLLIGDPGRPNAINSLARGFGLLYQPGYLYNVPEHDVNFQNIFVREFRPDDVTAGLEQVVLYRAGSIQSSGLSLALTDANTYSSMVERTEPFAPLAKSNNRRVLALADLTFMISPNNAVWDNERLIANLADYLTKSERGLFER